MDFTTKRKVVPLVAQDARHRCALVLVADGFEETEVVVVISSLRQAGLCVKSVGLTSGPVSSIHGVQLMPDLTLADLDRFAETTFISMVILPGGRQSISRLEADPRVHKLLRQIVAQQGQIAISPEGSQVLRAVAVWCNELIAPDDHQRMPVFLRETGQSPEAFARELVRRLK